MALPTGFASQATFAVRVIILSDGRGQDYWTLGLDSATDRCAQGASRALQIVADTSGTVDDQLVTREGSFGTRATRFDPLLVEGLRQVDGGSNVVRHHFDMVSLANQPMCTVVAIGQDQKTRNRAAKLALCSRLLFEARWNLIWNGQDLDMGCPDDLHVALDMGCPDNLSFLDCKFVLNRGHVCLAIEDAGAPENILAIEDAGAPVNTGMWADPLSEDVDEEASSSKKKSKTNKMTKEGSHD